MFNLWIYVHIYIYIYTQGNIPRSKYFKPICITFSLIKFCILRLFSAVSVNKDVIFISNFSPPMWANELWKNSKTRISAIKQTSDNSHSPNWAMRRGVSGYENTGNWPSKLRCKSMKDFSEPKFLHLSNQRKALNSLTWGMFPDSLVSKESACNTRNPGSISGSGRCTGERIGYHSSILGLPLWLSW